MLLLSLRRQFLLTARHKRIGHLQHPKTFGDKINWRILDDCREMPAWICDKLPRQGSPAVWLDPMPTRSLPCRCQQPHPRPASRQYSCMPPPSGFVRSSRNDPMFLGC